MSIQHVGAVLHEMRELHGLTDAFVLAVIADSADRRTGWTYDLWLSDVAKSARQTVRNVQKRLAVLERAGYVRSKLKGKPGRERKQFRVLFDFNGTRRPESELYPTPERKTGVASQTPVPRSPAPVPRDTPPAAGTPSAISDRAGARARDPSLSASIRKSGQKPAGLKKMPDPREDERARLERIETNRRRQLAELAARS